MNNSGFFFKDCDFFKSAFLGKKAKNCDVMGGELEAPKSWQLRGN